MKITLNWLREFVEVPLPVDELCEALVMAGIEVESVAEHRPVWHPVEVAEIVAVSPHPNADRLRLCTVKRATASVRVVCGAHNMQPGDKVALAPPGTELPGGRRIDRAVIRGQASDGMLCAERELGLAAADDEGGIMILPADTPLGARLVDVLAAADTVLELAPTPNRGDCLSVLGVAREVAALTGASMASRPLRLDERDPGASSCAEVRVAAADLCPRYCARVLRDVRVGPSPAWVRVRLGLVGLRAINNVVDATNYVMVERGQPLHAFDLARVAARRVTVRRAGDRQPFTTLDDVNRALEPDDLVIADANGPIALAGIMGGAESEIRPDTTQVLLESAFFTPETVRRTARRLGLTSDSSYRFERGVDPAGTRAALDRVAELIVATAGGEVATGILERRSTALGRRPTIRVRPARVNALLGTHLTAAEMIRPLRALGATVSGSRTSLRVVAPSHRFDLQNEADCIEEVARLTGYETIPATIPTVHLGGPAPDGQRAAEARLREALRGAGCSEMVTLALIGAEENRAFPGLPEMVGEPVTLLNPLSSDAAELRRSLLPGLLRALDENLRHDEPLVASFCLGRVYSRDGDRYHERRALGVLLAGQWPPQHLGEPARAAEFGDLRGAIDLALDRLHIESRRWERLRDGPSHLHPGKSAQIVIGGVLCGLAGALHPDLVAARRLEVEPWVAELDMTRVVQYCPRRVTFRPLPRFPAIQRDLAVVVEVGFQAQQVLDAIREIAQPLVEEVRVFDHYAGAPIPEGKKSLAYAISYRAADRTLTDDEVNRVHAEIVDHLVGALPLEVRR